MTEQEVVKLPTSEWSRAVFCHSLDGIIQSWSAGAEELYGYSVKEAIGQSLELIVAPQSIVHEREVAGRVGGGEVVERFHSVHRTKSGEEIEVLLTVSPLRSSVGHVVAALLIVHDPSGRPVVRIPDAQFASIVDSSDDAIMSHSLDGMITSWNRGAERMFGYAAEQAIGKHVSLVIPFEALNEYQDALKGVARGHRVEPFETIRMRRDGTVMDVSVALSSMCADGQIFGVASISRDLAQQKRAETERARLAAIVDASDDAIVSKTLEGIITSWNRSAENMFGYSAEEAIGRSINLVIPMERLGEEQDVLAKIRAGKLVDHFETVRVRKDGSRIDISLTVSPIRDRAGRIIGASKIARDISERKRFQEERDRLFEEAQRANRAKDEFLAMLGHELRNPLGAIATANRLLDDVGTQNPMAIRARGVINRQVKHLTRLVDDLLDIGRVMTGKILLNLQAIDLSDLVGAHLEALKAAGKLDAHPVTAHLEPAWAYADAVRVEQIITNLLSNAIKYTPQGGSVRVTVKQADEAAIIRVDDDGVGIRPDLIPHLFDLFVQGERSLDRSQGGLGIGLTLVRRLAELHGGTVSAVSEGLGKGSCFTVTLRAVAPRENRTSRRRHPSAPQRILIVEDNADAREMLRELLERAGNEVFEANDGPQGVEAALRLQPDVALVDIGLPLFDGYEVARQIRAHPEVSSVRLIAITGYGSSADRARSAAAGFDLHLTKPVDPDELTRILQQRTQDAVPASD